jgi:DNA polymerase (family X)
MPRSNDRAAEALNELADLLAITGGDPFRVRSYEKAARSVAAYPLDVDQLEEKALQAIPAVGSHIAAKIHHFVRTGHIGELDELRAQVPAGLRSLLGVPGLGPKRARQVYDELHVASVPDLLAALKTERLRGLHGWGEASEARLVKAMHDFQRSGGRMQLGVALEVGEELVGELQSAPGVARAAYAGSLRRMRETIGDVDLLVASDDPESVMNAFARSEAIAEVPVRGPTRAAAVTVSGVHVDLRVVPPNVWGAALLYFTGSKGHNVHLRAIARREGMKLSEYGLARAADGEILAAASESEIYEHLGMAYIAPTLREDRGEIEAALDGSLPRLVELSSLRGDLHTHTNLTDGLATLEEMVAAARAHGYQYFAVTDHAPLLSMQRMTTEKALAQREAIRAIDGKGGTSLLHGSELNIQPDGALDWDDAFLSTFDILVASVHSAFELSKDDMTARLVRAVEHPYVNVIGHPTARSIGHRPPIEFDHDAVFRAAARAGTALEINSFPDRLDLDDEMARRAQEQGVVLVISSDAHAARHLDNVRYGVATAQRGWVRPESVLNTWPLARVRRFLAKSRLPPPEGAARR